MDFVINGRFLTQPITGVQRYARELLHAFDNILDRKPEVRVTVLSPRLSETPPSWHNIVWRQVGDLRGHAWEQFELPWYSRGKTLFCPGNTAPVISLLGAQPTVVTVHDLSYRYFPDAYSRSFRLWYSTIVPLVLHRANAVITVSESERLAISACYSSATDRLHAIQNGGFPADFDIKSADIENRNRDYVLYVGSLSKRKNFPGILEAAIRLARKRQFRFVFVGGVPEGISDTGLKLPNDASASITFAGQVNDQAALASYYEHATCFLFPSFYEASPLPPIEAMACGCPVVASDIPSLRERCGDAALYCNPHDVDSIAATVERVIDDRNLQLKLQELGYQRAATFTWEHCARQTLNIISNVSKMEGYAFLRQPEPN
jgi:glycosyltransferase involved in cell wall biosynthesis